MLELAELADLPEIVEMILEAKKEGYPQATNVVVDKISAQVFSCFQQGLSFVLRDKNKIIGIAGYGLVPIWYNDDMRITALWFYVRPENRTYKNFKRLLQSAQELKKFGRVTIGLDSKKDIIRKHKLFNRLFETIGALYEV
jgi:hypothetical protein